MWEWFETRIKGRKGADICSAPLGLVIPSDSKMRIAGKKRGFPKIGKGDAAYVPLNTKDDYTKSLLKCRGRSVWDDHPDQSFQKRKVIRHLRESVWGRLEP